MFRSRRASESGNALCFLIATVLVLSAVAGCTHLDPPGDNLYQRLGGRPGIETIVESLLGFVADDLRIVEHFADADITDLRARLTEQFCVLAGGPCEYRGVSMEEAHVGMRITEADFNALVEDLLKAMDKHQIPVSTQNELLARLAPMRRQIIHR